MKTMCVVIAIASQHKWKVFQMDVKSTFLNGVLKEEVYASPLWVEASSKSMVQKNWLIFDEQWL